MAYGFRLVWVCLTALAVLTACGKDSKKKEDLCADVVCIDGTCDATTGECVSTTTCEEDGCPVGFICQETQCVAETACEADEDCVRGVCEEGACVNAFACADDTECLANHACEDGSCVVDMCNDVTCDRGVCDVTTGACVSAAVCSRETQAVDCVEGFVCYNQGCHDYREVCNALDCDRGACDAAAFECVQSEDCNGDDRLCLEGYFCNEDNSCELNSCEADGVECARGVCNPTTGACENAEECVTNDSCTDGFYCIARECVAIDEACIDCPGNQVCEHQESSLEVVCAEHPGGCVTTLDCTGARECNAGTCGQPLPCLDDMFEPNDDISTATDLQSQGQVAASICANDVDFYSFDTTRHSLFTGRLIAVVTIADHDIGVGEIEVDLLDEAGTSVASQISQGTDRTVTLDHRITTVNRGLYTLRVASTATSVGGMEYSVLIDMVDNESANMCDAPSELVGTVNGNTSQSTANALGSSCVTDNVGSDEAWTFVLDEPAYVTLTLSGNAFDAVLSLRSVCAADQTEISCANNSTTGGETLRAALDSGTYTVVVQGASSSDSGAYTLQLSREPMICSQVDNTCVDATTSRQCNESGTGFVAVTCDAGCNAATGACTRPDGDVCSSAIDATNGYSRIISLSTLSPDYTPSTGCSSPALTAASNGVDGVFLVTLEPGEVVHATATRSSSLVSFSWYLQEGCTALSSCVAWDASASGTQTLTYHNEGSAAATYYLFLDTNASTSTSTLDVEILVGERVCEPGTALCSGSTQQLCNAAGTAYIDTVCNFGCDAGACLTPPNDQCSGAIDVSAGGVFTGNASDYNNDYSPASSCTGWSAAGPDATYFVQGAPGDVVTVTLDGSFDTSLYAVTDCADVTATCLDGSDRVGSSASEEIVFTLPSTDPVFIIADAFSSSASGSFTLTVDVQTPDCTTPNEAIACLDGTTLQYCDHLGFLQEHTCATTCSVASCDAPQGDYCFDAVPVADGSTVTGNYTTLNNNMNPGVGTCIQNPSHSQVGSDAVYKVDLFAGDLLTVDVTASSTYTSIYVLSSCDAANSCERAVTQQKNLQFFAATTGTYYVVIDATSTFASGSFTANFTVDSGYLCQPGGGSCESGILTRCNEDGTNFDDVISCPHGCAAGVDACASPAVAPDSCATAEPVTASVLLYDTWSRFTNDINPATGNSCGMTSYNTTGADAVYEVALTSGQVLDARLESTNSTGRLYILTDCNDADNTCTSTNTTRVGYVASASEVVYLVVDNSSTAPSGGFFLDIDIRLAECTPAIDSCVDADTRIWCDSFGVIQTETCYFGCGAGVCLPPQNDQCGASSIDASAGGSWTFNIEDFVHDYSPGTYGGSCTGWDAQGPDATFVVSGQPGDVVTATMSGTFDASLYAVTDCGSPSSTCIDGSDRAGSSTSEEITFVLLDTDPVYIIADAYSSSATGSFTLDVEVRTPNCTPADDSCVDANTRQWCDSLGFLQTETCRFGCDTGSGECLPPENDVCGPTSVDITAGGSFTFDIADFATDHASTSTNGCRASFGRDATFVVNSASALRYTVSMASTFDGVLNVTLDCDANTKTCLDSSGSGNPEEVVFLATDAAPVYVIASAYSSGTSTGSFTLTVTSEPADCSPATNSCTDANTSQYCDDQGYIASQSCSLGCDSSTGTCAVPPNDQCGAGSIDVTAGGSFSGDIADFAIDYSPAFANGCRVANGRDATFVVNASAPTRVTASLNSSFDGVLYATTDCDASSMTCIASSDSGNPETITFLATDVEPVYIIADAYSVSGTGTFTLDVTTEPADCSPSTNTCIDANTSEWCDNAGYVVTESCNFGCDSSTGRCAAPTNDQCGAGSIDASAGGTWTFDLSDYVNDYTLPSGNSCTGWTASGADATFVVNAAPGSNVVATLSGNVDMSLYAVTDCSDTGGTCVQGSDDSGTVTETITFTQGSDPMFIIADAFTATSGQVTLTVTVTAP